MHVDLPQPWGRSPAGGRGKVGLLEVADSARVTCLRGCRVGRYAVRLEDGCDASAPEAWPNVMCIVVGSRGSPRASPHLPDYGV